MKDEMQNIIAWSVNAMGVFATIVEENEFVRLTIGILTAISIAVNIGYTIYKWVLRWKEINGDGEVTKEELDSLKEEISTDIENIYNDLEGDDENAR